MKLVILREEERELLMRLVSDESKRNREEGIHRAVPDSPQMREHLRINSLLSRLFWKLVRRNP